MKGYGSLYRHRFSLLFEALMLIGATVTFLEGDWKHFATSVFTFVVGFAPLLFERVVKVRLPTLVHALYTGFIFMSMFAGEVMGMYARIWEWDDAAHFISGLLLAVGGVLLAAEMTREKARMPVWMQTLFIVSLVSLVVVAWEMVEFGSDQIFGTFSQGGDLYDTMMDLIEGVGGGLIIALGYAAHARGKTVGLFTRLVGSYDKLNG